MASRQQTLFACRALRVAVFLTIAALLFPGCERRVTVISEGELALPPPAEKTDEAASLAAEFQSEPDEGRRTEIIYQLAINGTPPARQALERIYRETANAELKTHVITAQTFIEGNDLAPTLVLLQDALGANQPAELRTAAAETLRDLASPKTLPVWQSLLGDADEQIRETARDQIEFLNSSK